MKSFKMARLIDKRALSIGPQDLDGKNFESFEPALLRVDDSDINDHIDCQASGQLYYGLLTRRALENLRQAKMIFENWYSKKYDKCNDLIRTETGIKRPNKVDVENRVKQEYGSKLEVFEAELARKEYIYERLNLFYSAWITKGFSLSDLSARKARSINRDTRGMIGSSRKDDDEE